MNKSELAGLGLAALFIAGGISSAEAATPKPLKAISCSKNDRWVNLDPAYRYNLKATGAIAVFDGSIDGKVQNDNVAETSTVTTLKSKDATKKSFELNPAFRGDVYVLGCKANYGDTYYDTGRIISLVDSRLGLNDQVKRIEFNYIRK